MKRGTQFALLVVALSVSSVIAKELNVQQAAQDATKTAAVSQRLAAAKEAYDIESLHHRSIVFRWQHTASVIIFWMVLSLVAAGVAFSGIQFGVALRRKTEFSDAEIAMGVEGVKIRTQFLGVVTLALSLGFFYLYLKTVYPIVQLGDPPAQSVAPQR